MTEIIRPRWSTATKIVVVLLILILFTYLLFRFRAVLAPLVLAIILAYILSPVVNAIEARFKVRRGLAAILTYIIVLAVVSGVLSGLIPLLGAQISGLNVDFQRLVMGIENTLAHRYYFAGIALDFRSLFESVIGSLQGIFEPIFGRTLTLAVEVITSIVWVIFISVVSFYLIKDGSALRAWLENLAPPAYRDDYIRIREEIGHIWAAFFRGQLVLALVVTLIFVVAGLVLGLPFALAMGFFAGLLEFLPSVGHGIWLLCASLLAYFIGSTWLPIPHWVFLVIIISLHVFFQQFDLNYLIPRIIGRSVHLPPLVVILGIVTGALLAGVLGILLAAPTIASSRVVGRYLYANLFDLDPFPTSMVSPLPPPNPHWWRKKLTTGHQE